MFMLTRFLPSALQFAIGLRLQPSHAVCVPQGTCDDQQHNHHNDRAKLLHPCHKGCFEFQWEEDPGWSRWEADGNPTLESLKMSNSRIMKMKKESNIKGSPTNVSSF